MTDHFTLWVMKKIAHLNLQILKSSKQIKTLIFYGLIRMAQHLQEKCFDADIDANNNLFLIGSSNYNNTFGEEAVVLKINPNGTLLVSKSYGGMGTSSRVSI